MLQVRDNALDGMEQFFDVVIHLTLMPEDRR
jgi:hypothetical protein